MLTPESTNMTHPLPDWANELLAALEMNPVDVDTATLLQLAQRLNHDPETDPVHIGFVAGYAAGMAQGSGMADFDKAHAASLRFMSKMLDKE